MTPAVGRHELSQTQWARVRPLLPPQKPLTGRPVLDHRRVLNGILWVLRSGSPWRDLPGRYGNWSTVSSRFYRWCRRGVWRRVLSALQREADAAGGVDWKVHMVGSTTVRAHHSAAGARGGQQNEALGRSRGGFGTKLHLKCDGHGNPLAFALTSAQNHEMRALEQLLDAGSVKREGPGRPKVRPRALLADRGYSNGVARSHCRKRGIRLECPPKRDHKRKHRYDEELYRRRNSVERLVNRLKRHRRVATRYEKRACFYGAFLTIAFMLEWLR